MMITEQRHDIGRDSKLSPAHDERGTVGLMVLTVIFALSCLFGVLGVIVSATEAANPSATTIVWSMETGGTKGDLVAFSFISAGWAAVSGTLVACFAKWSWSKDKKRHAARLAAEQMTEGEQI